LDPEFIRELFAPFRRVTVRRMFRSAGIFCDGVMFGLVSDGAIFLKVDASTIPDFEREGCHPFSYTRGRALTVAERKKFPPRTRRKQKTIPRRKK
jgi:DNA transformation protein